MDKIAWISIILIVVLFILLPIVVILIYKYAINKPSIQNTQYNTMMIKETFDDNDKSAFFDSLLNSNSETQQLFLSMIDADTGTLKVEEIMLGNKKITEQNFTSASGIAKHNDYITPPNGGSTDDFSILVSPSRIGIGEPNSEQDNALLKFTCAVEPTSDKRKWKVTSSYKYRTRNEANGTVYYNGQVNYLIVPK